MRDDSDGKYVAISRFELVLDALAHDVHLAVELDAGGARRVGDEDLVRTPASRPAPWRRGRSGRPGRRATPRRRAPSSATIASIAACGLLGGDGVGGQERRCRRRSAPGGGRSMPCSSRTPRAGSGRGPGRGSRRRRRCRARRRWRRGGRGWSGPRGRCCTRSWLATPLMLATKETPHESCSNRGS